ncbi:hypothetical protein [Nocardia sp. X0981]
MPDRAGDIELPALLGMRGRPGRVFAGGLVVTIALYMVPPFRDVPNAQAVLAFTAVLAAAAILMLVPGDPLSWPATALVLVAGPLAVVLTHLNIAEDALRQPWAAFAFSYVLGVLVLRDRIGAAWLGVVAVAVTIAAVVLVLDIAIGSLYVLIAALATVAGASVCALILRPMQRSLRLLHEETAMRAAAEAAIAAEQAERVRQLERLDEVARPMLERIARGDELSARERAQCWLLEAELRDGLRAPQLVTDELSRAARGARARGVEVLLLDDGGFVEVTPAVRRQVVELAVRELDAAEAGSVTVRVLPVGRRNIATVLANAPGGDRRTEVATTGVVRVST